MGARCGRKILGPTWPSAVAASWIGLAVLGGGCGAAGGPAPQATLLPAPRGNAATSWAATAYRTPLAKVTPAPLVGRLLAVSISEPGAGNDVRALDPRTGRSVDLWRLAEITTLGDWLPRADGLWVLYRLSSASHSAWDRLLVQRLVPGAEPTTVLASAKMWQAHLAGVSWSGAGDRVAFGWQEGPPVHGTHGLDRMAVWELRSVTLALPATAASPVAVGESRRLWRSDQDPRLVPLTLAAWDDVAQRAMLLELAAEGGHGRSLWWLELERGRVGRRWTVDAIPADVEASPGGHWLAVPDLAAPELRLIAVAAGTATSIRPTRPGWQAVAPVWSLDGQWLAWAEVPPGGEAWRAERDEGQARGPRAREVASHIRAVFVDPVRGPRPGLPELNVAVPGPDSRPLAFSPDHRQLLVGERRRTAIEPDRLLLYDLSDGSVRTLGWSLPPDTWRIAWVW